MPSNINLPAALAALAAVWLDFATAPAFAQYDRGQLEAQGNSTLAVCPPPQQHCLTPQALNGLYQNLINSVPTLTDPTNWGARQNFLPSSGMGAGVNLGQGVAPNFPINGDLWLTANGLFVKVNGAIIGPMGSGGGGGGASPAGIAGDFQINGSGVFGAITPGTGVAAAFQNSPNANGGLLIGPTPASLVTFTPPWTGGVPRTIQARGQAVVYPQDFGASGSIQNTTATLTGGTAIAAVADAKDFVNGQWASLRGAGTTFAASPTTCSAASQGSTGSTAITYWVATLDPWGGYGVSTSCNVSNAAATLGAQNYVAVTITPGASAIFSGFIDNGSLASGNQLTVTSVASGALAEGETIGTGAAKTRIVAQLTGSAGGIGTYLIDTQQLYASVGSPGAMTAYAGYAVWKSGGNFSVEAFHGTGDTPTYNDNGIDPTDAPKVPSWMTPTHPTSVQNDRCVRGILGGGGTTTLTLVSPCPNSVSAKDFRHDDTVALNDCINAAAGGVKCEIPCGSYNFSGALGSTISNTRVSGFGRCTQLLQYGTQDIFSFAGSKVANQFATKIEHLTISGQSTAALGRALEGVFLSQFGPFDDVFFDRIYDGFHCMDCNIDTIDNLHITTWWSQYGSCYHDYSDGDGGGNLTDARLLYCSVNGGINNFATTQKCIWYDGHIQGAQMWEPIVASCGGEGLRTGDDIGSGHFPFGVILHRYSPQFTIGPAIHLTGTTTKFACDECQIVNPNRQNFVSCQVSAGVVADSGTSKIDLTGGNYIASSGEGMYLNGAKITVRPNSVSNNSSAVNGGTAGTCAGAEVGSSSTLVTVVGGTFGDSTAQAEPILVAAGAMGYSIGFNSFKGSSDNLQHVVNNSPGNGVVACNSGDVFDCVPPGGYGFLQPATPSGTWLSQTGVVTQQAGAAAVNGTTYFMPFYIPQAMTISGVGVKIQTSGASTVYAALYASNNNKPTGTPLMSGSAANNGLSNTLVTIAAGANYSVPGPGWYFVAIQSGDATAAYYAPNIVMPMSVFAPAANLTQAVSGTYGWSVAGAAGTWPTSLTTPSLGNVAPITSADGAVFVSLQLASIP